MARTTSIMLDVCEALSEAHAQGIIHRDLKPANVLLQDGERAVVVDFGMAKIVTGGGTGTTALTQHNMVFGTPEYMAPEQARGDELDARCDVYAAGVIFYQMLTGRVPFNGATPLTVLTAHLTEPPEPPRVRAPLRDISAALEVVVMCALAKDPVERYATAGALAAAIRSAVSAPQAAAEVRPLTRRDIVVDTRDGYGPTMPVPGPAAWPSVKPPAPTPALGPRLTPTDPKPPIAHAWVLVCVMAGVIGIAVGTWLSMRGH